MRSMRRSFALLFGAALVAMAFAAPGASAMEVRDADTGELCPEVSPAIDKENVINAVYLSQSYQSGGCTVHMEDTLWTQVGDYLPYMDEACYIDYDIHVGPDGWGYVSNIEYEYCGSWEPAANYAGSKSPVLFPGDYDPEEYFSARGADEDTDFNSNWRAINGHLMETERNVPLDARSELDQLRLENQNSGGGTFSMGEWWGDKDLLISYE